MLWDKKAEWVGGEDLKKNVEVSISSLKFDLSFNFIPIFLCANSVSHVFNWC